uniref:Transposase n=1 Tax=Klebsiella pneumoniae TaxID=573 RepID=A0A6J4DIL9_KLEPN|nr:hypothetical protein [Klebsiella pneumoniae]
MIVCAEMDEQWGYVGAKSRQRWLFYAYDRIRRTIVAHVFGERTLATLERLLSLLSAFEVVVWMTDGWPLYESRLKGKLHVISKRYTQRIERHNLNLRQHLARLGRKSLSFSKPHRESHRNDPPLSLRWSCIGRRRTTRFVMNCGVRKSGLSSPSGTAR